MRRTHSILGMAIAALLGLAFIAPALAAPAAGGSAAPLAQKIAATPQVQGKTGVKGDTYKSPVWGYSFKWNSNVWSIPKNGETSQPDKKYTQLELDADTGSLIISGFVADNGDARHCVAAEYNVNSQDSTTAKWTIAKGSNGKELKGGNSTKYYTVYTFEYTSPSSGNTAKLAAYFECRTLVKGQAVLVIDAFSPVNAYNDHIDSVNKVLDTIKIPASAGATPVASPGASPVASPAATPVSKGSSKSTKTTSQKSGIKGNTFTSPGFDFSMRWSNAWKVKDESIARGDEQLVLSNGTSTVRIWATSDYSGNLTGCVDYAVSQDAQSEKYANMKLATTSAGEPFQGADSSSAYSVFLYKGAKGVTYAHFVECQYIAKGKSVLIFTQDVPNSKWVDQRQDRRELQDSIKLPNS